LVVVVVVMGSWLKLVVAVGIKTSIPVVGLAEVMAEGRAVVVSALAASTVVIVSVVLDASASEVVVDAAFRVVVSVSAVKSVVACTGVVVIDVVAAILVVT
jgi:hypothetical protein